MLFEKMMRDMSIIDSSDDAIYFYQYDIMPDSVYIQDVM